MKTAYLHYTTPNIGDDVQSVALEEVLGAPDHWVNRDRLNRVPEEEQRLIANGWFICGPFPPPEHIHPTYVAICAGGLNGGKPEVVEHLKARAPIGCRDLFTLEWCESRGIEAYFASCPSILLERTIPYNPDGPIVVVDVNPGNLPPTRKPVRWLSNRIDPSWYPDPASRFEACRERLRLFQEASLVITHRLHVAMPCLGYGTPLIVTQPWFFPRRHTALPPQVRLNDPKTLKEMNLDPDLHRHDVTDWRKMVSNQLLRRLERQEMPLVKA